MREKEQILSRINIIDEHGNEVVYIYNRQAFDYLNIPVDYDGQFLQIGGEFMFFEVKYKVTNIVFKLFPQIYEPIEGGIPETPELTEMLAYNSQINVFVKKIG